MICTMQAIQLITTTTTAPTITFKYRTIYLFYEG